MTQNQKSQNKDVKLYSSYAEFISELKDSISILSTELSDKSVELESVRNYISVYTLELDNLVKGKERLENQIYNLDDQSRIKRDSMEEILREEQEIKSRITVLDKRHNELTIKYNSLQGEIEKSMEDMADRLKALDRREESLRIRENIITSREKKIQSYTAFSNL